MVRFQLITPTAEHAELFVAATRRSRTLHQPWSSPPRTVNEFKAYLGSIRDGHRIGYLVLANGEIAAFINIGGIIRGPFQNGFLGYAAFLPFAGQGYVSGGLRKVFALAFEQHKLHRLEANIQPENGSSIALVRHLGFEYEGLSRNYLKVRGRWKDHERYALTKEQWARVKTASSR